MQTAHAILATFDLSNEIERRFVSAVQHMHRDPAALIRRTLDLHRTGSEVSQLVEWSAGGFGVVRWTLDREALSMTWTDHDTAQAARRVFAELIRS